MEQPSGNNISQEQARESLIAISYTSPEEEEYLPSSDVKPITSTTTNGVTKRNTEEAEKLRCELISISYDESPSPSPSPDVAVVSPTTPNGFCRG
uniref:Uncharacterized protein n=1 Tax=Noccaea caerulescens TaxID=107243 RepID=A0A1J3E8X9_NOCCA